MEQDPKNSRGKPEGSNPAGDGKKGKNIWVALIATVVLVLIFSLVYNAVVDSQYKKVSFSDFMTAFESGELAEVELHLDRIYYLTKEEAAKPPKQQVACFTGLPAGDILSLARELETAGIKVNQKITEDNSGIILILYYVIMFALIFLVMRSLMKRMSGEGAMGNFGKSKAKVYMEKQ
jgi:ATP-dependent Zn protease